MMRKKRSNRRYCTLVQRQYRGRPACRGTRGWRSRSRTKLPHLGRHGTVPGRGNCTISTPHPGPCSRSKSITTHLVPGCKASSSRHHLGLACWTQAHKHRSTGRMQGWGRQSSRGKVHLQTDCPPASPVQPARSTSAHPCFVPTRSGLAVCLLPTYLFSPHRHDQPASPLSLSPSTQPVPICICSVYILYSRTSSPAS